MSPQAMGGVVSGRISAGLVRGTSRIVMKTRTTSSPMKMSGTQSWIHVMKSGSPRNVPVTSMGLGIIGSSWARVKGCGRVAERPGLLDALEARVGRVGAADLGARAPVQQDDVGGEVVLAADERGADAVGVDGHVGGLEL